MDQSPESLLELFRNPNKFPFEAIKSARADRARVAPLLIQALQKFVSEYQGDDESDCLTMIALYLLAEWEVAEAFSTVLDCFVLNDKYGGFPLGDIVTKDGPVILAALCQADLKALPIVSKANWEKFGRNDPCPCGSGKKYKNANARSTRSRGASTGNLPMLSGTPKSGSESNFGYKGLEHRAVFGRSKRFSSERLYMKSDSRTQVSKGILATSDRARIRK